MQFRQLFLILLVAALPAAAQATERFPASNRMSVVPGQDGDFAVAFRNGYGEPDYWCAAGEYVTKALRLPAATRIYRLSEPPRKQGEGVRFSLKPAGAASRTGLSVFGGGSDRGISATIANGACSKRVPNDT
jgi:hypothetical protein